MNLQTLAILAVMQGESYGLEIIERVTKLNGGKKPWFLTARIYPLLRRLERDGLLTTRRGDASPERGGRPRVYYRLSGLSQSGLLRAVEERADL